MGMLFNKIASPEHELEEWDLTYTTALKAKDTIMALDAYGLKAYAYYNMYNEDSVISITNRVMAMYRQYGHKDLAAGTLPAMIDVYLHRKKYDKAKVYMDYYEQFSGFFDTNGNIENGKESYYGTKAKYYNGIGKADSAFIYLSKLLTFKDNIQCAEIAYEELMKYYEEQGKSDSVIKYAKLFCRMNDSSAIVRSAEEINRAQALYNYSRAQQIAKEKTMENDNYRHAITYIVFCVILAMIIAYKMHTAKMRKQRMAYTEINKKYTNLWAEYDNALKENNLMESDFEKYKTNKENEIKALKDSISNYHECCIDDFTDAERALRNCGIALKLHSLAARGNEATEHELAAAITLVRNKLPGFYNTISKPVYKLTEKESKMCVLIRLNFIPSEIAVLFNLSLQRVTNIRSSINKKLFKSEGTKHLDSELRRLS